MNKWLHLNVQLPDWFTGMFPEAFWQIPTEEKVVYLTFDDGPIPGVTSKVLQILKENQIKATFFCVGENVDKYPEIFNQIIEEGHLVGNHTYNHIKGFKCSNSIYFENIEKANKIIKSNLFRPPYGLLKNSQFNILKLKYKIIMWDVISCDYDSKLTPEDCFTNVINFVRNGSIITFHDSFKAEKNVLSALPKVIEYLKEQGYSFRRIEFDKTRPLYTANWIRHFQKMRNTLHKKRKIA